MRPFAVFPSFSLLAVVGWAQVGPGRPFDKSKVDDIHKSERTGKQEAICLGRLVADTSAPAEGQPVDGEKKDGKGRWLVLASCEL